ASDFNANPGPEVVVMARSPAYEAPKADAMPAISSSASKVLTPKSLRSDRAVKISVAGVIGYDPKNNSSPAFSAAAKKPHAVAKLPFTFLYIPGMISAGLTM